MSLFKTKKARKKKDPKKARKKKDPKKAIENELDRVCSLYARNRDKFCQKCGKSYGRISAHHAFGKKAHSSLRYDVMNLVGLCFYCHMEWAHRDSAGFTEWFKKHIGEEQYNRLNEVSWKEYKPTLEELQQTLDTVRSLA